MAVHTQLLAVDSPPVWHVCACKWNAHSTCLQLCLVKPASLWLQIRLDRRHCSLHPDSRIAPVTTLPIGRSRSREEEAGEKGGGGGVDSAGAVNHGSCSSRAPFAGSWNMGERKERFQLEMNLLFKMRENAQIPRYI